jgi:hypothetical protein
VLVFALAVPNRDQINEEEMGFLIENENLPRDKKFRIDGDPLLAANMIASELVRGIGQLDGISLAYTYFYINDAVEYPRYLCAECHESKSDPYERPCEIYEFAGDFSNTDNLSYPLKRGFEVARYDTEISGTDRVAERGTGDEPETNIYVAFYPYDSYVYTPRTLYSFYTYDPWYWTPLWADPWWHWDPYYPGYSRHSFYFAWGWNWGSWGWNWGPGRWNPYYYSSWWYPHHYPYNDHWYQNNYYDYAYRPFRPNKYRYKSSLQTATTRSATRDRNLLIGSVRTKDRSGTELSRYYKARGTQDRLKARSGVVRDRTKSRTVYRERLKDKSREYIKRDKPHIYNDRKSKTRSSQPNIHPRKSTAPRDSKAKTYRPRDGKIERSKKPVSSKERSNRIYKPEKQRSSSPPARVRSSERNRSSSPARSSAKSIKGSSSRSGSSSKANRSGSSSGSSRSKSNGKSKR